MTLNGKASLEEIWFNPFLRVHTSGFTLGSTRYGHARIANRFSTTLHHDDDPVTVELAQIPTKLLREQWAEQSYIRQTAGGFRYNVKDSTLIFGRQSPLFDMYCQVYFSGKKIRIQFNRQYAAYTFLSASKLPHPARLAATLANIALIRQGVLAVHASSAQSRQRGVALLGLSNTGKTSSVVQLCNNNGWSLIADEVLLVNKEGAMFPNPFTTSQDFVKPIRHKLAGRLVKDGNERWGTLELYPSIKIGTTCQIESIYILEKRAWGRGLQQLTATQAANRIMVQNALEFSVVGDPFLQRLAYFQDWHPVELYQAAYEIALSFARCAKQIHELISSDTGSLVTTVEERLVGSNSQTVELDGTQSDLAHPT